MNIEYLSQELNNKINSLKDGVEINESQKEVLSLLVSLKFVNTSKAGYTDVITGMNISREGMDDFINLLCSNEYLKGYNNGGNEIFGEHPMEYNYDIYYLTLGTGIALELTFRETEIKGFSYPNKESDVSIRTFNNLQDLFVKVDSRTYGWPRIEILNQNSNSVFESNTTDEYLEFNNQSLNEALMPISVDDLINRFFDSLQKQESKGMKK